MLPVAAALGCAVGAVALLVLGWRKWVVAGGVLSLTLVPFALMPLPGQAPSHVGVSFAVPSLSVYAIFVVLIALSLGGRSAIQWPRWVALVTVLYLGILTLTAWGALDRHWSGLLHYGLLGVAFVAGIHIGGKRLGELDLYDWLINLALLTLGIEAFFCALQLFGVPLSLYPGASYFLAENRVIGTFNHPSTLGKYCAVFTFLALPAVASEDAWLRRRGFVICVFSVLLTGVTLSRANTVAVVSAIALFLLLSNSQGLRGRKIGMWAALIVAAVPASFGALERFSIDPEGGQRDHFLEVGLPFVQDYFFGGLGANSYVEVVGATDPLTALGYPLHNSFLLVTAELGIFGAGLVFGPILFAIVLSVARLRAGGTQGVWARAELASIPGFILIAVTGWGMIAGPTGQIWFLATGVAVGRMCLSPPPPIREGQVDHPKLAMG